jgi:hypothetical protein
MTGLGAHRAGKLALPPGYRLEHGADVLLLRRDDGSVAAAFSARGVTPAEVARTAEEDYRENGGNTTWEECSSRDLRRALLARLAFATSGTLVVSSGKTWLSG